ncbi:MAG: hypothetical protein AB7H70_05645 [Rhodospirillaceae bacterium]
MFLQNDSGEAEAFLSIRNLANKDPAIQAQGPAGTAHSTMPCTGQTYDCIGRTFRAGIQFKM